MLSRATRGLTRHPALSGLIVLCLCLGIGVNLATLSVTRAIFFGVPPGVRGADKVARPYLSLDEGPLGRTLAPVSDFPTMVALQEGLRDQALVGAYATQNIDLGRGPGARQVTAQLVTASYFEILGTSPAVGHFFSDGDESSHQPAVVVSFDFWQTELRGDSAVVGRTLDLALGEFVVVGVAPRQFMGAVWNPVQVWLPLRATALSAGYSLTCTECHWLQTILRVRRGISMTEVSERGRRIIGSVMDSSANPDLVLGPLQAARGPSPTQEARISARLAIVAFFILLVACANVANVSVAEAQERFKDIAIRHALGASPRRLLFDTLAEQAGVALLACLLSLCVSSVCSRFLVVALLRQQPEVLSADATVLLVMVPGLLIAAIVVARVLPMLFVFRQVSALSLAQAVSSKGSPRHIARSTLIAVQIAVTMALVMGSSVLLASIRNVAAHPLGFRPDSLLYVHADLARRGYDKVAGDVLYHRIEGLVRQLPGVRSSALAIGSPFATSMAIAFAIPGKEHEIARRRAHGPYVQAVSPTYFRTLGTRILRGRSFDASDKAGASLVAVVNDAMAAYFWADEDPLGQCILIATTDIAGCRRIVGVVENIVRTEVTETPTMQYYVPLDQAGSAFAMPITALMIRTSAVAEDDVPAIRAAVQGVAPDLPFATIAPLTSLYEWQLRPLRLGAVMLSTFGMLGLVLVGAGLYGMMSYDLGRQLRELAVRRALGATHGRILLQVTRKGLAVVGSGMTAGALLIRLSAPLWSPLTYETSSRDLRLAAAAVLAVLAVGVIASLGPTRRAVRVEPAVAMRDP